MNDKITLFYNLLFLGEEMVHLDQLRQREKGFIVMEELHDFIVFSKHLNISAAARELNISQPTLSKHLAEFERNIGIKLVVHGKDMRLTPAGKIFLDEAGSILHSYEEAIKKCKAVACFVTKEIMIQDPIAFDALQAAIGNAVAFSDLDTSTDISLVSTQGRTAIQAICDGIVDIAFMFTTPCVPIDSACSKKKIVSVPLMRDRLLVQMSPNHPLAQIENLSFKDLQNTLIMVPANKVYDDWRNVITAIFAKNNITPNFNMRVVQTINEFDLLSLRDEVMLVSTGSNNRYRYPHTITKELTGECNEFVLCAIYDANNENSIVPLFAEKMGGEFIGGLCAENCSQKV